MKSNSLTSKVLKGGGWMVASRILTKAVGIVATIILARILTPEAFGLVAVGLISVNILKVFTEVGIKQALIKETSENTETFLNTAWTVELIRGLLIFILVFFAAPFIASFFNQPEAIDIIRVLALVPLLNGITNIKIIYLQKELEFNKQFIYELSPIFGSLFISIPLAFILENVWAIVFGTIASEVLRVGLSYYLIWFLPKFELNLEYFKQMFGFGKWIFVSTIVSYFAMELDTYFAAKFFDARLLGIYTLAFTISTKPIIEVGKALTKVLFPAFAKMNNNLERIRAAYLKSSTILYLILVPLSVGLFLVAESFVHIFLGEKWLEMILPLKILSLATVFRGFALMASGIYNGIGRPELIFKMTFVRVITLLITLLIFMNNISLITISIAVLISNFMVSVIFFVYLHNSILINYVVLIKGYMPIIVGSLLMFLGGLFIKSINFKKEIDFILIIIASILINISTIYLFRNRIKYS